MAAPCCVVSRLISGISCTPCPLHLLSDSIKGESIDGTCKEKEDDQEDLSLFKLMDKIDGSKYSGADVKLDHIDNTGD